jgi:hypothetical protein
VEHIRGQVLGRVPIAYAPGDVAVDAREIEFVQFGKAAGIFLGSFDQQAVVSMR